MRFNTKLLHGTSIPKQPNREIVPPISQVSAFRYDRMEDLEKVFQHKNPGYAYTRVGNPTLTAFEARINELEGGSGAISCASGMAAITVALLAVCKSGDEIIAGSGLYGGTIDLFHNLENLGIHVKLARELNEETLSKLLTPRVKVVFGELISNPSLVVMDARKVADIAHSAGVPLFVDSTTATPYLARPLELGADVVVHSASKYINGGGNSIGGVIVDGGKFKWDFEKHGALAPYKKFGPKAFYVALRSSVWENFGGCMSPMNAFLCYIGADTLGLRMEKICNNADKLARALAKLDLDVNYLTLDNHPYRALVDKELSGRGGGILSFRAGTKERAFRIVNSLKYALIASNIGDVRSLVIHPASTLYIHNSREEMEAAGVYDDTIRVSVGVEDVEDLIEDFTNAVRAANEA